LQARHLVIQRGEGLDFLLGIYVIASGAILFKVRHTPGSRRLKYSVTLSGRAVVEIIAHD
jgi:hypothetical protein